ncbi:MAG: carboxypeptidase regulatory-like domain-containing protein, partial [Candidatus Electrothrix sp. AR3]|nr:carboxypeptidase regulatory-like domain-containing protein [Candidatus Electrothrix sp. AR3]
DAGGAGIPGHVDVYDENYTWVASDRIEITNFDGHYEVTGLDAAKQYKLFFDADTEYISQWYYESTTVPPANFPPGDFCSADSVTPDGTALPLPPCGISGTPPCYNAVLKKGESISGKVEDAPSSPLALVFVDVFNEDYPSLYEFDYTDMDGKFRLSGLPLGSNYKVRFKPHDNFHVTGWYNDKYNFDYADPIVVNSGNNDIGTIQIALGGSISGTVTEDAPSGNPIFLALVDAELNDPVRGTFSAVGVTDATGLYTVTGLPASNNWKVQFMASWFGYVTEWYNNQSNVGSATPVNVSSSLTTGGINAQLALGSFGCISGTVTDGSNPVAEVIVEVYNASDSYITTGSTNPDGTYTITEVPAGNNNKVRFFIDAQDGYCSTTQTCYVQWSTDVDVLTGSTSCTVIDAALVPCGGISGIVTDVKTGNPVAGVRVEVYNATLLPDTIIASGSTDSNGTYTINGVPGDSYNKVRFVANSLGYKNQWYDGEKKSTAATLIPVAASVVTPNIDAALKAKKNQK